MSEQGTEPAIIAIAHQKGGTGKTTTVCNLAASFARPENGLRVIVIDLDPQAAASIQLSDDELSAVGAYDVIVAGHVARAAIQTTKIKNCLLIPATERLVMSDLDAATRSISFQEVSARLRENLQGTDLIILDCPAGFGTISTMAMTIADLVVVPTPPLLFESRALAQTIEHVERLRRQARSRLAVVLTMIDPSNAAHEEIAGEIREEWRSVLVPVEVPRDPAIDAAILADEFIVDFAPESPSALAYRHLAVDLGRRVGLDLPAVAEPLSEIQAAAPVAQAGYQTAPVPTETPPPIQQGPVPEILRRPPEEAVRAERPDDMPSAFPAPRPPSGVSPTPTTEPVPVLGAMATEPQSAAPVDQAAMPTPTPAAAQAAEPAPMPVATPAPTPAPVETPPPIASPAAPRDEPPPIPAPSLTAERHELSADEAAAPAAASVAPEPAERPAERPAPKGRQGITSIVWKVILLLAVMAIAAVATFIVLLDIGYLPWVLVIAAVLMVIIFLALLFRLL